MGTTIASDPLAAVSTAPELPMPTLPPFELELSRRKRPMTDLGCLGLFIPPFFFCGFVGRIFGGVLFYRVFVWCFRGVVAWVGVSSGQQLPRENNAGKREKEKKEHFRKITTK